MAGVGATMLASVPVIAAGTLGGVSLYRNALSWESGPWIDGANPYRSRARRGAYATDAAGAVIGIAITGIGGTLGVRSRPIAGLALGAAIASVGAGIVGAAFGNVFGHLEGARTYPAAT